MSAEVSNIQSFIEAVERTSHAEPRHHTEMSGESALRALESRTLFTSAQRAQIYCGQDRMMIPNNQLERIYILEKNNDQLQREAYRLEQSLNSSKDPFANLAGIEHAKMSIAKNTGEILKIYDTTAFRLQRIAELEIQNEVMNRENEEKQSKWTTLHNMEERTNLASSIFMNKDLISRNELEISMLRNESAA
jgi:hypothetical protein